jgi:aryl-alcohol dehydrogenase-like predicted oxidoreductase
LLAPTKDTTMTEPELRNSGLKVSATGLGCMGMRDFYDPRHLNDEEPLRVSTRHA